MAIGEGDSRQTNPFRDPGRQGVHEVGGQGFGARQPAIRKQPVLEGGEQLVQGGLQIAEIHDDIETIQALAFRHHFHAVVVAFPATVGGLENHVQGPLHGGLEEEGGRAGNAHGSILTASGVD